MYHGFVEFCSHFLEKYPGYTIYPIRLNGSAIESYFSQLRAAAGPCNLTATNYSSVSATVKLRGKTKPGNKKFKDDYRKSTLSFRQHKLERKRRKK